MRKLLLVSLSVLLSLCVRASETGICSRVEIVNADGNVLSIDISGCLIEYDTNDWTGTIISVDMGTNGNLTAGTVTLSDSNGVEWILSVWTNGTLRTIEQ